MKQRILVAVVGIPALLGVLCFAPDWATMALIMGLCIIGSHELLAAVLPPEKTRRWCSWCFCAWCWSTARRRNWTSRRCAPC